METKNSKQTNGTLNENAETLNNSFNVATSAMNEFYQKQQNLVFGFYNNMFNPMLGMGKSNYWGNPNWNFSNLFNGNGNLFNGNGNVKSFFNPLPWMKTDDSNLNIFNTLYENFSKQLSEYYQNWLNTFQNKLQLKQSDWLAITEKYQELLGQRLVATKKIVSAMNDAYTKKMDFSIETNTKMYSELNAQMNNAIKSNEEFWNSVVKNHEAAVSGEEETVSKTVKKEVHQNA